MVGVDAQLGKHCDFFRLRWDNLGIPPPYINLREGRLLIYIVLALYYVSCENMSHPSYHITLYFLNPISPFLLLNNFPTKTQKTNQKLPTHPTHNLHPFAARKRKQWHQSTFIPYRLPMCLIFPSPWPPYQTS